MKIWYVHKNDDGSVASVHEERQEGYAEETIREDDPAFPEWARPALIEPPAPPTPAEKLAAAGLTVEELRSLLGM